MGILLVLQTLIISNLYLIQYYLIYVFQNFVAMSE